MPVKTKKIHHRNHHDKHSHRRSKKFLRVYAPYIPLLLIVSAGFLLSFQSEFKHVTSRVLNYATNTTDDGLLESTNEHRARNQLPALQLNRSLDDAAQAKANDMAKRNYWSHTTPDGQEPWTFIEQTGYKYIRADENLAYGFDSSASTLSGWMNSPSHKANVLDAEVSEVGFGIVNTPDYQGTGPETIVVAMYAKPLTANATEVALPVTTTPTNPNSVLPAQNEKKISYLQSLTNGRAPWSSFAIGLLIGGIAVFLAAKNAHALHRRLRRGESFIVHHPLLDITLVALIALAAVASQTAGTIH